MKPSYPKTFLSCNLKEKKTTFSYLIYTKIGRWNIIHAFHYGLKLFPLLLCSSGPQAFIWTADPTEMLSYPWNSVTFLSEPTFRISIFLSHAHFCHYFWWYQHLIVCTILTSETTPKLSWLLVLELVSFFASQPWGFHFWVPICMPLSSHTLLVTSSTAAVLHLGLPPIVDAVIFDLHLPLFQP